MNKCLSLVFTSSGLLRKNQAHPSIFRLLDEALHFHVQAHGYGFSAPYRLAQALLAYACFYFANPQACNTVIPVGLPPFCSRFHPMSGWLLSNISYCTSIFSFPLSVFFYYIRFLGVCRLYLKYTIPIVVICIIHNLWTIRFFVAILLPLDSSYYTSKPQ